MNELFKNKYRTDSVRLKEWDYSWPGLYYVTICTKDRFCCLGDVKNGLVYLSEIGKIVFEEWLNTPKIRPNVALDDFIIMPNHIHGIIEIKEIGDVVETHCNASLQKPTFGPQRNNLASIIRGFKGVAKKRINQKFGENYFAWQSGYYEHIVRDEDDYARIKEYIALNPIRWELDRNNPKNRS
ncbi:MAG: transposase [Patescibacteria group bacterium]